MIAVFDSVTALHLRRALELYARRLKSDGCVLPPALVKLLGALNDASRRQQPTNLVDGGEGQDDQVMASALLTYEEVAQRLRCGERTVDRLVAAGSLKTVAIGKLRRVHSQDLAEYVDSLRVEKPETAA